MSPDQSFPHTSSCTSSIKSTKSITSSLVMVSRNLPDSRSVIGRTVSQWSAICAIRCRRTHPAGLRDVSDAAPRVMGYSPTPPYAENPTCQATRRLLLRGTPSVRLQPASSSSLSILTREGFRRAAHAAVQGSTTSTSMSSKSRTLHVATAIPRTIATTWKSAGATVRPAERCAAAMSA